MNEKHVAGSPQVESPTENDPTSNGGVIPEQVLKHSKDGDDALQAVSDQDGIRLEVDEATNKRLLRKIDLYLMPVFAPLNLMITMSTRAVLLTCYI